MPCFYMDPTELRACIERAERRRPLRHILRGCSAGGHRNSKVARKLASAARSALGTTMQADINDRARVRAARWA